VDDAEDTKNTIPSNNKNNVEEILFFEKYNSNIFLQFICVRFFIKYSSQLHAAFEPNIFQPPKY